MFLKSICTSSRLDIIFWSRKLYLESYFSLLSDPLGFTMPANVTNFEIFLGQDSDSVLLKQSEKVTVHNSLLGKDQT